MGGGKGERGCEQEEHSSDSMNERPVSERSKKERSGMNSTATARRVREEGGGVCEQHLQLHVF